MWRAKTSLILIMLGFSILPSFAVASEKPVLISEVQTSSIESAGDEFVEIYNNSGQTIDISGWGLYYKSATGANWSKKATLAENSLIAAGSFWLFATLIDTDTKFNSGLSGTGGNIQLRDETGNIVDQFGWGGADSALGQPASPAEGGQSMYRLYDFDNSLMQNTDNNFADFDITNNPTPNTIPAQQFAQEADPTPITLSKTAIK